MSGFGHPGIVEKNEAMYKRRAVDFVGSARAGDLDKMMRYTSPLTIKIEGEEHVRTVYREKVIPAFKNSSVSWDERGRLIYDERKNSGFLFSGTIVTDNRSAFSISVFGEGGEYVVGMISRP